MLLIELAGMRSVGREEHVKGRGVLNLLTELGRGRKAKDRMNARLRLEFRPRRLKRRGKIGRRRDRQRDVLRGLAAATTEYQNDTSGQWGRSPTCHCRTSSIHVLVLDSR